MKIILARNNFIPDPPASFKFTFSNDPNPMSFLLGGGGVGIGEGVWG